VHLQAKHRVIQNGCRGFLGKRNPDNNLQSENYVPEWVNNLLSDYTELITSWDINSMLANLSISHLFTEPEGSVMYPKQLTIGSYFEPDESSA
jgi:hypothetical protein